MPSGPSAANRPLVSREITATGRFLAAAEEECRSALLVFDFGMAKEPGGRGVQRLWALQGVRHQLEARIRWIEWVRRRLAKDRARRR